MHFGGQLKKLRIILPFVTVLLAIISAVVASGFTASQTSNVNFSVTATTALLAPGDTVQMTIQLQPGLTPASAIQAYLNFDASVLRVVDSAGAPASTITAGPIFAANGWTVLQNSVDNNAGTINFAGGKAPGTGTDVTSQAALATFFFEAQASTSGTNVSFATTIPRQTKAVSGFNDVTGNLTGISLAVVSNTDVSFNFSIQGRGNPGPSWTMPVTVEVFAPGSDGVITSATVTSAASTTSSSSVTLAGMSSGTYDLWFKGDNTLAKLMTNVSIASSSPTVNMGEVIGGDATGGSGGAPDNVVDAGDYSNFLSIPIGTATGTLSATQRRQDHNRDGIVDIVDYAVIVANFGIAGAAKP